MQLKDYSQSKNEWNGLFLQKKHDKALGTKAFRTPALTLRQIAQRPAQDLKRNSVPRHFHLLDQNRTDLF